MGEDLLVPPETGRQMHASTVEQKSNKRQFRIACRAHAHKRRFRVRSKIIRVTGKKGKCGGQGNGWIIYTADTATNGDLALVT